MRRFAFTALTLLVGGCSLFVDLDGLSAPDTTSGDTFVPDGGPSRAERAAALPSQWKLDGRAGKRIFKDAMRPLLPAEIFSRPKSGFSLPLSAWLRKELREYGQNLLLGSRGLAASGLFEKTYLERLWKEHQSGMRNHAFPIFALLSFAGWRERFQGSGPLIAPALPAARVSAN